MRGSLLISMKNTPGDRHLLDNNIIEGELNSFQRDTVNLAVYNPLHMALLLSAYQIIKAAFLSAMTTFDFPEDQHSPQIPSEGSGMQSSQDGSVWSSALRATAYQGQLPIILHTSCLIPIDSASQQEHR